jgi:Ca-activated chloride channel family protein
MLRRRRRFTIRYSSLSLVRAAMPRYSRWRRHLPFALFLLALTSLLLAMARPVSIASVPAGSTTIILAIDASRSMCSTDVAPNRMVAAQSAALSFIHRQPPSTQIGIVAFGGFAAMLQAPTNDQEILEDVVQSLTFQRRTAVGSGILKSLDAISEVDSSVAPSVTSPNDPVPTPVPHGAYAPAIIVVLTDGASNQGPLPEDAAQQAADRGVRVYTIGYGTAYGGAMNCGASQFGNNDPFGGRGGIFMDPQFGGGGGGNFRRGIDEDSLKRVADITGGKYYSAESADQLQKVFDSLPLSLILKHEVTEISFIFAGIGALFATLAIALSMLWNPLP